MKKIFSICIFLFVVCFLFGADGSIYKATVGGKLSPDGKEINVDLPGNLHQKNTGGSDGSGLCVFSSITAAARYQNEWLLIDFTKYMTKFPGGGYPEKVTQYINKIAKEKGVEVPDYIQMEGSFADCHQFLQKALDSGRMPCVTYGYSPSGRYGGRGISHMVNMVHMDDKYVAILDNNYCGDKNYEWLTLQEFAPVFGRQGWTIVFLCPGPPTLCWN